MGFNQLICIYKIFMYSFNEHCDENDCDYNDAYCVPVHYKTVVVYPQYIYVHPSFLLELHSDRL